MNPLLRILLIVFLAYQPFMKAQDMSVDELKAALKKDQNDTSRIKLLSALAETADENEWPAFNAQVKALAEEKLKTIKQGHPEYKFYMTHLANALGNEGFLCNQNGKAGDALEFHAKGLAIREAIGDKEGIAYSYNNMGTAYETIGDIPKALEFFYKGLKIREELGIKESIAVSLNNIGLLYSDQGENKKALEFYQRALKIQLEIGDKEHAATSLNNIGGLYSDKGEHATAFGYYKKSIKIREEIGDIRGLGYALNNMGLVYVENGDPEITSSKEAAHKAGVIRAMDCFMQALQIAEKNNDQGGVVAATSNIGFLYLEEKNYPKSIEYGKKALAMAEAIPYPNYIRHASLNLYRSMKALGKNDEALKYYENYIVLRDTLKNQANRKAVLQSQLRYEFESKAAADSIKVAEEKKVVAAQLKAEKTQRFALYAGLILVILFSIFMVNRFRVISKQKDLIEQKERETQLQKEIIEEKQKEIIDSINYAKRIQQSLLATEIYIQRNISRLRGK